MSRTSMSMNIFVSNQIIPGLATERCIRPIRVRTSGWSAWRGGGDFGERPIPPRRRKQLRGGLAQRLGRAAPGVVLGAGRPRGAAVTDQGLHALGIGRREEKAHRNAF